ncbi:unnamed protein product [Lathyrus oleraceus]
MERKNNQKNGSHPFSSSGIFSSVFSSQSPLVLGRESVRFEVNEKIDDKTLNSIIETQDEILKNNHRSEVHNAKNINMSSTSHDQITHSCNFSSSIYYGGEDIIPNTQSTQNVGVILSELLQEEIGGKGDFIIESSLPII